VTWSGMPLKALGPAELKLALERVAEWAGVSELTDLRMPKLSGDDGAASAAFWKRVNGR
jgi:hypothetical protein